MDASVRKWLVKTNRLSAWGLLIVVILFLISGYSMAGKYGFETIVTKQAANRLHLALHLPLIVFFLFHSSVSILFALQRWGWVKKG